MRNDEPRANDNVPVGDQWCAGFFEGEGNARVRSNRGELDRLVLSIAQVRREPLDAFALVMGAGSVRGPYGPYSGNRQPHFQYMVMGQSAIFGKADQVRDALDLYQEVLDAKLAA